MQIKDELISKSGAIISLVSVQQIQDTATIVISITSAIISIAYTLYKWYQRIKNSKQPIIELEKIVKEISKDEKTRIRNKQYENANPNRKNRK